MPVRVWAVGLFVTVGLILFAGLVFLIGDRHKAFGKHLEFQTEFSNLSGIARGAKVRVSGVDAGKVKNIDIPRGPSERFRLELEVDEQLHGMIRRDSVVSIETEGVVGDKFVLIKRGSDHSEAAQAGATLPSKEPLDLSAMMDRASILLKDVHQTVNEVRGRLNVALDTLTTTVNHADGLITEVQPTIQKIAQDGSRITGKIDGVVTDIGNGKGSVGLLLKDEATRQQIQAVVSNIQDTSKNVNEASARANQVIGDFQSRDLIAKTQVTLENVQAVSAQLNTSVKEAFAEDNMGDNGAANLRQTLSNLNRSTANLADDTEALKHNFFFRGFFKKRGFFSLDQIAPADYLEACERNKKLGTRKWLPASSLFIAGADGQEQLSLPGRRQIDNEIGPVVTYLAGHLVVVEGYSPAGSPSQQLVLSRSRADLVRRYLEAHYHLRHSDIGIVALGSSVPKGGGQDQWDGAGIMLLEMKSSK